MKKEQRDFSMLYGVLAGIALFALVAGWIITHTDWDSPAGSVYDIFPDGYQIVEDRDSRTFRDGTKVFIVKIPSESSDSFSVSLREKGFVNMPLPDDIYQTVSGDPEIGAAADISNGLWWFKDRSPKEDRGKYTNYTLHIYNLDTCVYDYFESDS